MTSHRCPRCNRLSVADLLDLELLRNVGVFVVGRGYVWTSIHNMNANVLPDNMQAL